MARQIFLHIGRLKTGTSALQKFFLDNRDILRQRGLFLPMSGIDTRTGAHHPLALSLLGATAPPEQPGRAIPTPGEVSGAMKKECGGIGDDILVTSEFFDASAAPALTKFAKDCFPDHAPVIVVYLRRQDLYVQSLHMQFSKLCKPVGFDKFLKSPDLDHAATLEAYRAAFPSACFVVRPYEKGQFHEGDLMADFCFHVCGWQDTAGLKPPGVINPRMSHDALAYKIIVDHLPAPDWAKRQTLAGLIRHTRESQPDLGQPFQDHFLLSPALRRELLARHAAGNERIAREYLGRADGILFREPPPEPDEAWEPYPGLAPRTALEISAAILKEKLPHLTERRIQEVLNSLLAKGVLEVLAN